MCEATPEWVWHRSPEVAVVDDGERIIVLPLDSPTTSVPRLLTGTASLIWRLIDGKRTTADVARNVRAGGETPDDLATVLESVASFLSELLAVGALKLQPPEDSVS